MVLQPHPAAVRGFYVIHPEVVQAQDQVNAWFQSLVHHLQYQDVVGLRMCLSECLIKDEIVGGLHQACDEGDAVIG